MFKKNDPLVETTKAIMERNEIERKVTQAFNEELGVQSKNQLPHEYRKSYDDALREAIDVFLEGWKKEELEEKKVYSYKAARAGKDIGEKGKSFEKIAKEAGARYGSEEKGKKVAGAILKKIRAKHGVHEELKGSQHELDTRPPFGKLTKHDFEGLRQGEKGKKVTTAEGNEPTPTGTLTPSAVKSSWDRSQRSVDDMKEEKKTLNPYAVGMAAAKKKYGYGDKPAHDLPKKVIKKGHEIAKKIDEDQINELMGNPGNPFETGGSKPSSSSSVSRPTQDVLSGRDYSQPSGPNTMQKPDYSGSSTGAAKPGETSKIPTGPNSAASTQSIAATSSNLGAKSTSTPTAPTPSILQSKDKAAERVAAGQNQADMDARAAARAAQFKKTGGPGGAVGTGQAAGAKIATQVAQARGEKPPMGLGGPKPTTGAPRPTGGMRRPGGSRPGGRPGMTTANQDFMTNLMREETKPEIKESFESFLRNKFLKG